MITPEEQQRLARANAAREASAKAERDRREAQSHAHQEQEALDAAKASPEYRETLSKAQSDAEHKLRTTTINSAFVELANYDVADYAERQAENPRIEMLRAVASELAKSYEQQGFKAKVIDKTEDRYVSRRPGFNISGEPARGWTHVDITVHIQSDQH